MKITALSFVHVLLQQHPGEVFQPHVAELLPPLIACAANEPFYKITAEALLVLQQMVRVVRPIGECWRRLCGGSGPQVSAVDGGAGDQAYRLGQQQIVCRIKVKLNSNESTNSQFKL